MVSELFRAWSRVAPFALELVTTGGARPAWPGIAGVIVGLPFTGSDGLGFALLVVVEVEEPTTTAGDGCEPDATIVPGFFEAPAADA